ncbi:transcription factor SPN1-like [Sinocyclocheilus grahami]|uniref:transcription factor SPN1-like n=1 Tax=Sinocyclocheilus grahami TaxID=75366 RepID=UPI0007AC740C|nr:PREDICTED: transcription factor SPN1-like [Sinocyclocheilus grahami]
MMTNASVSSVLQSPVKINISKDGREEIDSSSSGNAEFNTASSGARLSTETSQGPSEETEHPIENNDVGEKGEEVGDDDPSDSERQWEQESSDEKVFDDEDIAEKMEGCEGENPCQIHDHHPDRNSADNASSQKRDKSHSLDETERASSTLDEDLQRMFLERATEQRNLRDPGSLLSDIKGDGDVREDLCCPEGDYIETAAGTWIEVFF